MESSVTTSGMRAVVAIVRSTFTPQPLRRRSWEVDVARDHRLPGGSIMRFLGCCNSARIAPRTAPTPKPMKIRSFPNNLSFNG